MDDIEKLLSKIKPIIQYTFDRHKRDLEAVKQGKKPHLRYNRKMARAYIIMLETMKHYKGEWAGKNFILEEWQKKAISICFGWERKNQDGIWVRRFDESFWHIPKKNGKTILGSGSAVADAVIRPEQGGEVYAFATKSDQARLAWDGFNQLIKNHSDLQKFYKLAYSTITLTNTDTVFKKLGKDTTGDGIDGISATFGLADEKHAHANKKLEENIKSSMASRLQPHFMSISTAGFDSFTHYYEDYEYAKDVVMGVKEDDSLFVLISEAPPKPKNEKYKDWYFHKKVWQFANPNYGVSVKEDFVEKQIKNMRNKPSELPSILVKNLNVWRNTSEEFISIEDWNNCKGEIDETGEFVGGLDLSISDDFTSFMKVYKKGRKYYIKSKFYLPKIGIEKKEIILKTKLQQWIEDGWITLTEGKNINYIYIYNDIIKDIDKMKALCYDSYKAKYLIRLIEEPLDMETYMQFKDDLDKDNMEQYQQTYDNCIPITQGYGMLSEPTILFQKLVESGDIVHDGNPVLRWMISNITVVKNPQGNIMLNKSMPHKKIDGVAGIINALALMLHKQDIVEPNIYESRGLIGE